MTMTPDQLREWDEWSEFEKRIYSVHGAVPPDGRDPADRYKGKVDPSIDRVIGDLESSIMAGSPQSVSVRAMKRAVGYLRAHAAALEEIERVKAERDAAHAKGREAGMREASEIVPSNWLDPLLTGPKGLGSTPWDGETIERLLRGIRDAILSAIEGAK